MVSNAASPVCLNRDENAPSPFPLSVSARKNGDLGSAYAATNKDMETGALKMVTGRASMETGEEKMEIAATKIATGNEKMQTGRTKAANVEGKMESVGDESAPARWANFVAGRGCSGGEPYTRRVHRLRIAEVGGT